MFKVIKLRNKNPLCCVCGDEPTQTTLIDYTLFCGSGPNDKARNLKVLEVENRITVQEYHSISQTPHLLIDVRQEIQYRICSLPNSVNIEYKRIEHKFEKIQGLIEEVGVKSGLRNERVPVYVICRRGNDSQLAVNLMKRTYFSNQSVLKDIIGGISQWNQIEKGFPVY